MPVLARQGDDRLMVHPTMFDDGDPVLIRLRKLALDLPGAAEKVSHGRPTFYTVKVFAYYGGSLKVDGVYEQHHQSVLVLPDPDERLALVEDPRCYVPAYLGPYGWVGFEKRTARTATGPRWPSCSTRRTATPPRRSGWPSSRRARAEHTGLRSTADSAPR
jgi:hypothetical protein